MKTIIAELQNADKVICAMISNQNKIISSVATNFKYRAFLYSEIVFLINVHQALSNITSFVRVDECIILDLISQLSSFMSVSSGDFYFLTHSVFDPMINTTLLGYKQASMKSIANLVSIKYRMMCNFNGLMMSDVYTWTMDETYYIGEYDFVRLSENVVFKTSGDQLFFVKV